jgi:sugar phosphate isomerase/epimerase
MASESNGMTRRTVVTRTLALAGAATLHSSLGSFGQVEQAAQKPSLKVGCLSWCFHSFDPGADPEPGIDIIGSLGFDGVELIVLAADDLQSFWTDTRIDRIRRQLDRHKLELSQLMLYQPVVGALTSLDRRERNASLENFSRGCNLAKKLGANMVDIVAPWPCELSGPRPYLPRYYEIEEPKPGTKFHIDIAASFNWDLVWNTWIETVRDCVRRAKEHGLRFSMEHHTHCIVHDASTFLTLWNAIGDATLGYSLDIGWTLIQREYPPIAVHKVKKQLLNVHVRDIDSQMRTFVHFGTGVMDVKAVVDTLKQVGYRGFVSIEQDKHPGDMRQTCERYLRAMREFISQE